MIESKFKPVFIKGWKLKLGFLKILKSYYFSRKKYPMFSRSIKSLIRNNLTMRNKLFFTKNIMFNNQLFFSPAVPAFPSKAFDNMAARGGLNFYEMGTPAKSGIESLFIAISDKCLLDCKHCYEAHNLKSNNHGVGIEKWKEVTDEMQKAGANTIIFTGGEPLQEFDKMIELLEYGNKELSDFHIHTSGYGLTNDMVKKLKSAGLKSAAVGLDDFDEERFDNLRGKKGLFKIALKALEMFNKNGIFTYVNTCITKDFLNSGDIYKFYDLMKEYSVSIIQLLEPRPWGGYFEKTEENILTNEDKIKLTEFVKTVSTDKKYSKHPLAYYVGLIEHPGNLGCTMGGLSHMHIDSAGNVNPCVFLPVSFGNINEEKFSDIYKRMRKAIPKPVKKECPSIALRNILENNPALEKVPLDYKKIRKEFDKVIS